MENKAEELKDVQEPNSGDTTGKCNEKICEESSDIYLSFHSYFGNLLNKECCNQIEQNQLTSLTTKLFEEDTRIQAYKTKLDEQNQSLRAVRQENEHLERYISHVQGKHPLMNSVLKGDPPLNAGAQEKYLQDLDKEIGKFGVAFETMESDKAPVEVENPATKYALFNQCIEEALLEMGTAPSSEDDLETTSYTYTATKCNGSRHLERLEKLYEQQEQRLNEAKEIYDRMMEQRGADQEHRPETCKEKATAKLAEAFNETEILLVQNNIGHLRTTLTLTNKRVESYAIRQRQLICELNEITAETEQALEELNTRRNGMCNRACEEQRLQQELTDTMALIAKAERTHCALSKLIREVDAEICLTSTNLRHLMRNKCREKECRKRLRVCEEAIVTCDNVTSMRPSDRRSGDTQDETAELRAYPTGVKTIAVRTEPSQLKKNAVIFLI